MLMLRAQFAGRIVASEAWNLLFPKGEWHGENLRPIGGSIVIDDAMLEEMVANWRAASAPPLPVYKTHAHLDDDISPLERAELSKAYGYLTDFRVTAEGLEAKTEWTPAGKRMVDEGEFAFWSPEWQPKHVDRRTGDVKGWWLSATALCSNPFFDSMPQLAAQVSLDPNSMPRLAASDVVAPRYSPTTKETMTPELKKRLKMALKCEDDTTDEDLVAAFEKKCTSMTGSVAASELEAKLTAATKQVVEPLEAKLVAATAAAAASAAKVVELEKQIAASTIDTLIASAKAEGRAVEPLRSFIVEAFTSGGIEKAKALIAAAPKMTLAPVGNGGTTTEGTSEEARTKLSAAAADIAKSTGMSMTEARINASLKFPELAQLAAKSLTTNQKEG